MIQALASQKQTTLAKIHRACRVKKPPKRTFHFQSNATPFYLGGKERGEEKREQKYKKQEEGRINQKQNSYDYVF